MRYAVWSTHVSEDRDAVKPSVDVLETTRTDRKVAEEDRALIASCFHRKAWIQEVES